MKEGCERNCFTIGTFNVRGLNCDVKKHQLVQDLVDYKLDILCVQESKIQDGCDVNILGHRVFPSKAAAQGSGNSIPNKNFK